MEISFNTKPAVSLMSASFDGEVIDELNEHIEDELIDAMENAKGPIKFSHTIDYVGKMFGDYICRLGNTYMENTNKDVVTDQNMSDFNQSISGREHLKYDLKIKDMGVQRIFSDTIEQGATTADLSCILYLKVPDQVAGMVEVPGWGMIDDGKAGETTEGYTHLSWGQPSENKLLKPATDQYLRPEVGRMLIFPSWVNYVILPFSGEGELRVLTSSVIVKEK